MGNVLTKSHFFFVGASLFSDAVGVHGTHQQVTTVKAAIEMLATMARTWMCEVIGRRQSSIDANLHIIFLFEKIPPARNWWDY